MVPTPITPWKPRVTLTVVDKPISFLIDTGTTYSDLPEFSGPTYSSQVSIVGVDGLISKPQAMPTLNCLLLDTPFRHSFLIVPRYATPILSWDILSKFRASLMLLPAT